MREILFSTKSIKDEEGNSLKLTYSITVSEPEFESGVVLESYGVKVSMSSDDGTMSESEQIDDIFVNSLEIEELLMLLSVCTVTPISLYEVMDDYLAN